MIFVFLFALVLEILLKNGLWDNYIKPQSYLGNAVYRQKAINEFGLENIHWITVGDSRFDWGLEHGKILNRQKLNGLNHLRMSFESSNFMAIQATIDWSMAHMPNLQGIMLGVSEDSFGHYSNVTNQYSVAWSYKDYFNYKKYKYFSDWFQYFSLISRTALYVFYNDINDLFRHLFSRSKHKSLYLRNGHQKIFNFNRNMTGDICDYSLASLTQCIKTAQKIKLREIKLSNTEKFITNICSTNFIKRSLKNNQRMSKNMSQMIENNWQQLFQGVIEQKIKLKVVVLPEHTMFSYVIKPVNTNEVLNAVFKKFSNNKYFEVLDISDIFNTNKPLRECTYYKDPLHFNNNGKSHITQIITNSF